MKPSIERLPLFVVALRCLDGSMAGEGLVERGLFREAAEKAAAAANQEGGEMFVAIVKPMRGWRLVRVA